MRARSRSFSKLRYKRPRPHLDDKILTSWNGLMISALAKGAQILGDSEYLEAAQRAVDFFWDTMYSADTGKLLRRFRDGEAAVEDSSTTTLSSPRRCSICMRRPSTPIV